MLSFTKFLKIVLPIATATTATIVTASLISVKKLDQIIDDSNNQKFESFDLVNEDFDEKVSFTSEDGKKEEISTKDLNKAKEIIENLKKEAPEKDLPFESKEQVIDFLNKFPKKSLNELLQESKLSNEQLENLHKNDIFQNSKLGAEIEKKLPELEKLQPNIPQDLSTQIPQQLQDVLNNQNIANLNREISNQIRGSEAPWFDSLVSKLNNISVFSITPSLRGVTDLFNNIKPAYPEFPKTPIDVKGPEFRDENQENKNSLNEQMQNELSPSYQENSADSLSENKPLHIEGPKAKSAINRENKSAKYQEKEEDEKSLLSKSLGEERQQINANVENSFETSKEIMDATEQSENPLFQSFSTSEKNRDLPKIESPKAKPREEASLRQKEQDSVSTSFGAENRTRDENKDFNEDEKSQSSQKGKSKNSLDTKGNSNETISVGELKKWLPIIHEKTKRLDKLINKH